MRSHTVCNFRDMHNLALHGRQTDMHASLMQDTSIDAMIDHGAGAVEHEVSSTLLEDIEADNSE